MKLPCATLLAAIGFVALAAGPAGAQSLASRVLVVYNSNPSEIAASKDVADYYVAQRSIPAANLCPVAFSNNDIINLPEWTSTVQPAIRACLNAVGRTNILYIVLSYKVPIQMNHPTTYVSGSVDSHIADIWDAVSTTALPSFPAGSHRYFANPVQSHGFYYPAFQTFQAHRAGVRAGVIYSVWRLWGADVAKAKALVTRAINTELAGGLTGKGWIDRRLGYLLSDYEAQDHGIGDGDFDMDRAARMMTLAGLTVVLDENPEPFGTAPAPTSATDIALYTGWYTYNQYRDLYTWNNGAIGWQLDSASAFNLNSPTTTCWVAGALNRDITITAGSITEPFQQGLPQADIVFRHLLQGGNAGDAFLRGTPWLKWKVVFFGDPLYRPYPNGLPTLFNTQPNTILTPQYIVGGKTAQMTIDLGAPAPSGGKLVALSATLRGGAPASLPGMPASVTIPAGSRTAKVNLGVTPVVTEPVYVLMRANYDSVALRNTLGVFPLLGSVQLNSTVIKGGNSSFGFVVLNDAAPAAGVTVALASDNPALLTVPATVTVPRGTNTVLFNFTTSAVGATTTVKVTATSAGASDSTTILLQP